MVYVLSSCIAHLAWTGEGVEESEELCLKHSMQKDYQTSEIISFTIRTSNKKLNVIARQRTKVDLSNSWGTSEDQVELIHCVGIGLRDDNLEAR